MQTLLPRLLLLTLSWIWSSQLYAAPSGPLSAAKATGQFSAAQLNSSQLSAAPSFRWAALFTLLTFVPACFVTLTPFLRISVVLHFLRQALGTQSVPSNQVILGLSLFLTLAFMQPVLLDIYSQAIQPYEEGQLSGEAAWAKASGRIKTFLLPFAREKEIQLMVTLAKVPVPRTPEDLDLRVIAPAYILSELQASFKIGVVLFLPFLVLDLVAASITLALGMVQLPPVMISAPFKILLFVLVDGWSLVIGSLMRSFQP